MSGSESHRTHSRLGAAFLAHVASHMERASETAASTIQPKEAPKENWAQNAPAREVKGDDSCEMLVRMQMALHHGRNTV